MDEKKRYYDIFTKCFNFCKPYIGRERNEQFWDEIVDNVNQTVKSESDQDREIVKDILLAILADMERRRKNG